MSFTRRRCFAVLSLLLVSSLPAIAQVSAAISGRVTDQTGAGVPGATVIAKDTDMGVSRVTVTDAAGRYELPSLALGRYEVDAVKEGVAGAVIEEVLRGNSLDSPKSVRTMWPSAPMRMFSGFRSRYMTPAA